MTPSESIIAAARSVTETTDSTGRRMKVRTLTALDTLRLFKAAGPDLAQNQPWIALATLAMSVSEIDGVPVPTPVNEAQIESVVDRLGDAGLTAVADALEGGSDHGEGAASPGNSPSTPA
jgi:hypothetical protein